MQDQIEAFAVTGEITAEQEQCMLDTLAEYSDDQLKDIASENDVEGAPPSDSLQSLTDDFAECTEEGATAPASSEPSDTTDG